MKLPPYCCAILTVEGGVLLEARPPRIRHAPGKLTCFGGRREPAESAEACLRRELTEELGWAPAAIERKVELWVGGALIAWFYEAALEIPVERLVLERDRRARVARPEEWASIPLSDWHRAVLEAWRAGRTRVDLPPSPRDTA